MSEFAAYLKELLDECGRPIAAVARGSGVERTSIHKALKDERTLPYQAVRRLADYLQLDLGRSRELSRRYEMLVQGEESYAAHAAIRETLLDLSRLSVPVAAPVAAPAAALSEGLVTGSLAVAAALRALVACSSGEKDAGLAGSGAGAAGERDAGLAGAVAGAAAQARPSYADGASSADIGPNDLFLYLPPGVDVADALASLWRRPDAPCVRQLVSLAPDRAGEAAHARNLEVVRRLLQVSLTSGGRFFSYCTYGEGVSAFVEPLPYFVVAGGWLARLDEHLTLAHLTRDGELVSLYRERLSRVLRDCRPLNSYSSALLDVLEAYMSATDDGGYYTVMTMPCLGRYYTRDLIEQKVRPEVPARELVVELADRRFARLRALTGSYYTLFTEEGLRRFAEDGVVVDLPSEVVAPFDVAERARVMRRLCDDVASGSVVALMADPTALAVPPYLTITVDPRFGLHVYAVEGYAGGAYSCSMHLDEPGIGRAFVQFVRALPRSRWVLSDERTLEVLEELASGLEARAGEGA